MISSIFEKKPVIELNDFSVNHLISIENDKLTLEEVITNNTTEEWRNEHFAKKNNTITPDSEPES